MRTLFAVTRVRTPPYDFDKPLEAQQQWAEHAAFMDQLVEDKFIILGGPMDETEVLLIVDAPDEATITETLARDPWTKNGMLETREIKRWTIRLDSTR